MMLYDVKGKLLCTYYLHICIYISSIQDFHKYSSKYQTIFYIAFLSPYLYISTQYPNRIPSSLLLLSLPLLSFRISIHQSIHLSSFSSSSHPINIHPALNKKIKSNPPPTTPQARLNISKIPPLLLHHIPNQDLTTSVGPDHNSEDRF